MPIYICNKNILIILHPCYTGKQNNFTRNKVGKPNSMLCAEFKYVSLFLPRMVLSEGRLKFEENLCVRYITKSTCFI